MELNACFIKVLVICRQVQLNDEKKPLELIDDHTFPDVHPVVIPGGKGISIGAHSFGFIVFPEAKAAECV